MPSSAVQILPKITAGQASSGTQIAEELLFQRAAKNAVPDRAAWKTFDDALRANDKLSGLLGRNPPEIERAEAFASLLDVLRSVGVRDRAEESGRVRILSASSARALRIPYLFFAGLAERSFPPPDRQDRLYSEAEYRTLIDEGLPLVARSERNREEMLLFYEVMTRASRQVSFSYPALDEAAQPLSASPYLDEVELACGPGRIPRTEAPTLSPIPRHDEPLTAAEFRVKAVSTALEGNVSLLADLVHREPRPGVAESILAGLAMVEARQDRNTFGPTEGLLDGDAARREMSIRFGPAWTFTATELEQYASCPYQFFLDRVLGLEPLEDLDLSLDYRARGRLVHRGLADFHQRVNEHGKGPTSPAALDEEDYRRLLGETYQRLTQHAARGPLDAALHEVDLRLWTRWADDYRRQHEAYDQEWQDCGVPLRPTWFEVSFGHSGDHACRLSTDRPLELSVPGGVIRIAGRIDRIDTGTIAGQTVFNVLDYKTGTSTRYSRDALTAGTALQLPLYAMATQQLLLAEEHAVPWQAGYWALQQNGFKPKQALRMYECRDERLQARSEWESVQANVVANVATWVEEIRAARFPVSSADVDCTRLCPFRTICRINHVRSLGKTWEATPHED
ncbi:MAG: PD-(D/E)XK nuclease family protein [Planctomycetota bacterium]